jgi:hypothetical protein
MKDKMEKTFCITDVHVQAEILVDGKTLLPDSRHDPIAISPVIQALGMSQPEKIIIMGDFFDNQHVSGWTKKINQTGKIMTEDGEYHFSAWRETLRRGEALLRYIRKICPNASITFLEGNHEFRSAQELRVNDLLRSYESASIRDLEIWKEIKAQYIPWNGGKVKPWIQIGDATIMHGFGTSENQYMLQNHRVIHGDSHAIDLKKFAKRNRETDAGDKDTMWSWAIGCLCHLRPEFATKGGRANAWEHGFATLSTYKGLSQVDVYRIVNGTVVNFYGKPLNYIPLGKLDNSLNTLDYTSRHENGN